MIQYVQSSDHSRIAYESVGDKEVVLLFVHGWLGNKRWWDHQRDYFQSKYQIVQMDLAGHGNSDRTRTEWSAENYAHDIIAVAEKFSNKKLILVGHSMSGAYGTIAAAKIPNIELFVLVDTLKNLEFKFSSEQIDQMMNMYRNNFEFAVPNILPQYLFVAETPKDVKEKLQKEFLSHDPQFAGDAIEGLYKMDVGAYAPLIKVPTRAINSTVGETTIEINRKYYRDYDCTLMDGVGHYPMLEKPQEFNQKLEAVLKEAHL